MLKLINLYVIEQIFLQSKYNISSWAKMFYINCLLFRFRGLDATKENTYGFHLEKEDFPHYEKNEKYIIELQLAGFVDINDSVITFNNLWGPHIDRSQLLDPEIQEEIQESDFFRIRSKIYRYKISTFVTENFQSFIESWCMKNSDVALHDILDRMDLEYCSYEFEDENHVRNSFKSTYNKIKTENLNNNKNNKKDYLSY